MVLYEIFTVMTGEKRQPFDRKITDSSIRPEKGCCVKPKYKILFCNRILQNPSCKSRRG